MSEPYVIATSSMAGNPVDIVTVETDDGLTGYGEAHARLRVHRRDAVDGRRRDLRAPGADGNRPQSVRPRGDHGGLRALVGNRRRRPGLELALWDLQGKALGRPVCDLIGGRTPALVPMIHSFGYDDPRELAATARRPRAHGVTVFKVKVGDAPERDAERVAAVREAVGPTVQIKCDANTGWRTPRRAIAAIRLLEPYRRRVRRGARPHGRPRGLPLRARARGRADRARRERARPARGAGRGERRRLRHHQRQADEVRRHPRTRSR